MSYEDYYENTSPFDEEVESFKDHLRAAVKEEVQKELGDLRAANTVMTRKLANLTALEQEAKDAVREYKQKLHNAEVVAYRTVQKEGLRKLLGLLDEPRYRVAVLWEQGPKCGKCNENRHLTYTTPRGKAAYEACECAASTQRWTVEEQLVHEVARRSGKILAWYTPVRRYSSDDDDSLSSPTVLQSAKGMALEDLMKNPRDYGFTTEAAAAHLANALNKEDS